MSTEKFIDIDGHPLFYKVSGEGKTVVLLHGFAEDNTVWHHQVEPLQAQCRLIIPDLPGSGRSALHPSLSMESMATSVHHILQEELKPGEQAIMIGHSMGGYITLAYAELYPDQLSAIALFHSTAYADNEEKKATRQKGIEFMLQHGGGLFIQQSTPNMFSTGFREEHPEVVKELIERYADFPAESLVAYYQAMMARPDRTAVLKQFTKPVLFLAGETDAAIPLEHVLQQSYMPATSQINVLKHSGHMGMLEEADAANRILLDFLSS